MSLAARLAAILTLGLLVPAAAQAKVCPADVKGLSRRIVSCNANFSLQECRKAVEAVSCSVYRELASINAVVITVPNDEVRTAEGRLAARPEVRRIAQDRYRKWIQAAELTLPEFGFPPIKEMVPAFTPSARAQRPAAADPEQPWGISRVNAAAAWPKTMGRGVKVAVIDTGIDFTHPDLAANVKGGFNATDPNNPDNYKDDHGHGSHVAGTIAAIRDGKGVAGVAPEASLYAVKVCDSGGGCNDSDIIAGIEWAVKNKTRIANMSLGSSEGADAIHEAVIAAQKAGLVIMAAAGNDSGGPVSYPAAYPEAIAVSASNDKDGFAYFSSKGPEVSFIAPGQNIKSVKMGGGYTTMSGTSMATPHMTGLAALAVATGAQGFAGVKNALIKAGAKLPGLSDEQQGHGLVNAGKLVR